MIAKDYHSLWLNSAALALAGGDLEVEGGVVERDAQGEPTGVLREEAAWRFKERHLVVPDDVYVDAMRAGPEARGRARGHLGSRQGRLARRAPALAAARAGGLADAARVAVGSGRPGRLARVARDRVGAREPAAAARLPEGVHGRHARLGDGADARRLGRSDHERRAARRDHPRGRGGRGSPSRCTRSATARTARRSTRSRRHAPIWEPLGLRHRIEHAQLLSPEDLPRFASLGVACSVQFSHAPSDRDLADRFWAGKTDGAYAYRSLLDSGAVVANGSDAPIEELDPLAGIRAGVRRTIDAREAWHPEQALTVQQAFEATTLAPGLALRRRALARPADPGLRRRPRRARPRPVGRPRRRGRRDDGRRPLGAQPAALGLTRATAPRTRGTARAPRRSRAARTRRAAARSASGCSSRGARSR